ncbi:peptidoglycan-associated lipoprotein Pal [Desulfobacula toluolica]|uniref:Peptidoglycan-associated lipoprotein n=1 Tax=Desulfobacula toluolica (strain DSM 7467 / Tol2) TaxID=651182 RepID=K0NLF5_DESTT|nr:peptidoglycan-associated lipoprotein Pal [Desulfobacula toluolica]CCK79517.1 predicted peptidoglycan-associated lipoprotein [Desulfobacula toluolica Tol2]
MKNRVWINLTMAILVAGLFFAVSCAKKTIVSDATAIEDQAKIEADKNAAKAKAEAQARANAQAREDADRIAQQELEDRIANEKALRQAKIMAAKKRFENQNIHFEYDSSQLSPMAKTVLKEKAAWLKANYSVSVTIEGHCDDRGTTEYNLSLGERRAAAAKAYLVNLGVSASRLNTVSYGEEQPEDFGKTEDAYRKNRRAHFAID